MDVEFKKDLHHTYMVISQNEFSKEENYCIKLLKTNSLPGMIKLEQRSVDNSVTFYYDITAKQTLNNLLEKSVMSCDQINQLFTRIIDTIERGYEFLLNENDFILEPEFIFLDLASNQPYLCYLPGHHKSVKEQMSRFIEYIMNKVDYNDKDAVLIVYNLYGACREEGYTFHHLMKILQGKYTRPEIGKSIRRTKVETEVSIEKTIKSTIEKSDRLNLDKEKPEKEKSDKKRYSLDQVDQDRLGTETCPKTKIEDVSYPIMLEKITGEQETNCYPYRTYLYTVICVLLTTLLLTLSFKAKIVYNSLGSRIEYSKLFALLLIVLGGTGYLLNKIWDKKNKISKIIKKQEYIDPRIDSSKQGFLKLSKIAANNVMKQNFQAKTAGKGRTEDKYHDHIKSRVEIKPLISSSRLDVPDTAEKEEHNSTCLLNDAIKDGCYLKPVDDSEYETIKIKEFPFFIGKLKKNVDYCLENNAVSRYHAKITKDQDNYYLTDLNSTNGTFLNNEILPTYQKKEMKPGDEIRFANINYVFINQ